MPTPFNENKKILLQINTIRSDNFHKMQTIDFTVFLRKSVTPETRKLEKPAQPKGNVMGLQNKFVDLRILLVKPDVTEYDLLQMTLDGFQFDQSEQVSDAQSALDQLYFNNFDLILLADDLPVEMVNQLLTSIATGDTGDCEKLNIIYSGQQNKLMENHKIKNLQFMAVNGDSQKFSDDLKMAFDKIITANQVSKITNGRCQRNDLST
jgi:PleD family two-component response regulator